MSEPPRDPLAEHPLGTEAPRRKGTATLPLFPDLKQASISGDGPRGEPQASKATPAVEAIASGGAHDEAGSGSARAGSLADQDDDVDEPGEPIPPESEASAAESEASPAESGVSPAESEVSPSESEASQAVTFARRLVAGLADLVILALVGAVELTAGAFLLDLSFPPAAFPPLAGFLAIAALLLLVLAPFVWGTTPGMALADLRIRAEDGGSPTLAASFLRFVGFALTLTGVPLLVAAFDRRGRTLADLLSGTVVTPAERAGRS